MPPFVREGHSQGFHQEHEKQQADGGHGSPRNPFHGELGEIPVSRNDFVAPTMRGLSAESRKETERSVTNTQTNNEEDSAALQKGTSMQDNGTKENTTPRQGGKLISVINRINVDESEDSDDDLTVQLEASNASFDQLRPPLPKRMLKADRRLYQNILHTTLVEDRLRSLEQKVKDLQGKDPTLDKIKQKPWHTPTIQYLRWDDFRIKLPQFPPGKRWEHGNIVDPNPHSVLEVLIEEPRNTSRGRQHGLEQKDGTPDELNNNASTLSSLKTDQAATDAPQIPVRVRIRSPVLLKILQTMTSGVTQPGEDRNLLTILRPFKLLISKADEIKAYLEKLEKKYSKKRDTADRTTVAAVKDATQATRKKQNVQESQCDIPTAIENEDAQEMGPVPEIESSEALEHMRILVDFIQNGLKHIWELRRQREDGTLKKIAFADLWHLFDYDQEIRTPDSDGIQLYRVKAFTGGREPLDWSYDPKEDSPAQKLIKTTLKVLSACNATTLPSMASTTAHRILFFRYAEIREKLLVRGTDFTKLSGRDNAKYRHKKYAGLTVDDETEQVDSEIIIDFQWAYFRNPTWKPNLSATMTMEHDRREVYLHRSEFGACGRPGCCGNDIIYDDYEEDNVAYRNFQRDYKDIWDRIDNADDLVDDQKILLPRRAYGFVLRSRKWAAFAIELLREVTYTDDGWSNLELPEGHKETVLALVENHAGGSFAHPRADTFATMDLVKGKGKGLIILLHGAPRVGKTSTAECVAERTRRPLFSITCGDIGDNAYKVEEHLENNFQLAHRWGCVLLLDEADVFLQKRGMEDLARNSIVSVFLRTLEYYSGILFLTTNRVGKIDPAFKSRIHLSLLYPQLDRQTTVKIWKNHIARIKKQVKTEKRKFEIDQKDIISFSRSHYDELARMGRDKPWNGRQIRNAFQTAMALAEYAASTSTPSNPRPKLNRTQFKKVAKTSMDFDAYLQSVWGGRDDSEIAERDQARNDGVTAEMLREYNMPKAAPLVVSSSATERRASKVAPTGRKVVTGSRQRQQQQLQEQVEDLPSEHPSDDDDDDDDDDDEEDIGTGDGGKDKAS